MAKQKCLSNPLSFEGQPDQPDASASLLHQLPVILPQYPICYYWENSTKPSFLRWNLRTCFGLLSLNVDKNVLEKQAAQKSHLDAYSQKSSWKIGEWVMAAAVTPAESESELPAHLYRTTS